MCKPIYMGGGGLWQIIIGPNIVSLLDLVLYTCRCWYKWSILFIVMISVLGIY